MSREKVEIVRRIYEAWGRGDFQAGVEPYDPNVMFVLRPEFPEPGRYCGVDEITGYFRGFLEAWERVVIAGEEFLDAGDSVVVGVNQEATGEGSGAVTNLRYYMVWTFRGSSVIRFETIMERSEALESVGVSE